MKIPKGDSHFLFLAVLCMALLACEKPAGHPVAEDAMSSPIADFRDIPGVTAKEIAAIEELQKGDPLIFGTPLNTEAFIGTGGKVEGYIAQYCDWMAELLGIRFIPEIFILSNMLDKLNSRDLDFGIVRGREDLRREYYVTDAIGQRMIVMMRIKGSRDIGTISMTRLPRYAFIQASSTYEMVVGALASGSYEELFVANYEEAYAMLKSGAADALIEANVIEGAMEKYDDAYSEIFLPLFFNPIVMITGNPLLEPVISVVTRALQNGASNYLIRLYEDGYRD
jgi:ABC-type amino acid transport substrate-binding protein